MSERTRLKNGRFVRTKVKNKVLKALASMQKAKEKPPDPTLNHCRGKRLVDIQELAKNMICCSCKEILSLAQIQAETRMGLHSIFNIKCTKCSVSTAVHTSKTILLNNCSYSEVNSTIVLGAIHSGSGCDPLNKILACADTPTLSKPLYKRYEKIVGELIEKAAHDSCKRAAEEERRLVIKNIDEMCKHLPHEIVNDIYPHRQILESSTNPRISEDVEDTTSSSINVFFDEALGNIINIVVSYDMGWSKRGNGRSYNSLNGYGTIIGFFSGKILDYTTRNRKCRSCDLGIAKDKHNCRLNFDGSAKAMEADAGVSLINKSPILKEVGLNVRVVIGDEDSSTIAAVRSTSNETIYKLADRNHLAKNFGKELYSLAKTFKELNKKGAIAHVKKCFSYAIAQNKGDSMNLAKTLQEIPNHLFGQHENCGAWCHRAGPNSQSQTVTFVDLGLYNSLDDLFKKYATNSNKFSVAASSQSNESVNNMIAHKAHKNVCLSTSAACDFRVASAVCCKNDGEKSLLSIRQKLNLSPGKHTTDYVTKADQFRLKRSVMAKSKKQKARRKILSMKKENLRKKNESSEGITYQSNCGMNLNTQIIKEHVNVSNNQSILSTDCEIVYFDLETSGLAATADVLQIAGKSKENIFNVYVNPIQTISPTASAITGLTLTAGQLYLHGKLLVTVDINDALRGFQQFLCIIKKRTGKNCLLVAHNARFDMPRLLRVIVNNNMISDYSVIAGFADSLSLFRKALPERKGRGAFQLSTLAKEYLENHNTDEKWHDAEFDITILEKLVSTIAKEEDLFSLAKTFDKCLTDIQKTQNVNNALNYLTDLKGTLSKNMLKKIAEQSLTFSTLQEAYTTGGEEKLLVLLSQKDENNRPLITKDKKVLQKIIDYFKTHNNNM